LPAGFRTPLLERAFAALSEGFEVRAAALVGRQWRASELRDDEPLTAVQRDLAPELRCRPLHIHEVVAPPGRDEEEVRPRRHFRRHREHRDGRAGRIPLHHGRGRLRLFREQFGDLSVTRLHEREETVDDGSVLSVGGDAELLEPCRPLLDRGLRGCQSCLLFFEFCRARRQLGGALVHLGGDAIAMRLEAAQQLLAQTLAPAALIGKTFPIVGDRGCIRQGSVHGLVIVRRAPDLILRLRYPAKELKLTPESSQRWFLSCGTPASAVPEHSPPWPSLTVNSSL
jgi:hypothetical protein